LSPFGPIPRADGLRHVFRCHLFTEIVCVSI
jgi:hypothetical protein